MIPELIPAFNKLNGKNVGINIPAITVPVRPGRNLAIILEIAAMNHRQKKMGYNTAAELEKQLLEQFGAENE